MAETINPAPTELQTISKKVHNKLYPIALHVCQTRGDGPVNQWGNYQDNLPPNLHENFTNAKFLNSTAARFEGIDFNEDRSLKMMSYIDNLDLSLKKTDSARTIAKVDFLVDITRGGAKLWSSLSDSNFNKFMEIVSSDKIPVCLTSSSEVNRLYHDQSILIDKYIESQNTTSHFDETRPQLSSARERLIDLCLHPSYYVKDDNGHALNPPLGGPKNYEFDPNVDIVSVFEQISKEFSNG